MIRAEVLGGLGFAETTTPLLAFEPLPAEAPDLAVAGARAALGTRVSVTALAPTVTQAQAAIAAAFEELDRLASVFSRHDPDSALSALNGEGRLEAPPPELSHVVSQALAIHAATRGAFDVTVKPVLDLLAARIPSVPPAGPELAERAALVDARQVRVGRRSIRFARAGMGMTLDGIAKGYIADRMAAVLERQGLRRFLIDAGGDIRAAGRNPRGGPWVVAVRDPAGGPGFADVIALGSGAVATSGGYERFYAGDPAFHHIVAPDTGRSPPDVASVSVAAPDGLTADALATAVFVLGADQGLRFIDRLPRCAALVLDGRGTPRASSRWAALRVQSREGSWS